MRDHPREEMLGKQSSKERGRNMIKAELSAEKRKDLVDFLRKNRAEARKVTMRPREIVAELYVTIGEPLEQAKKVEAAIKGLMRAEINEDMLSDPEERAANQLEEQACRLIEIGLYLFRIGVKVSRKHYPENRIYREMGDRS